MFSGGTDCIAMHNGFTGMAYRGGAGQLSEAHAGEAENLVAARPMKLGASGVQSMLES